MAAGKYLFTSESVSMGHPDKLADQISDGVLDALLRQDPYSRVACETMVTTGMAIVAGEITTKAMIDYAAEVRHVIREVGYTDDEMGINADTCAVMVSIDKQSPDIAQGVNEDDSKRQGNRRRRPGPDVRLCLQRHARADAAADRPGAPDSQPPDRGPAEERSRLAAARQQEPGDDRVRRPSAGADRHGRGFDAARSRRVERRDSQLRHQQDHQAAAARASWSTAKSSTTSIPPAGSWSAARTAIAD